MSEGPKLRINFCTENEIKRKRKRKIYSTHSIDKITKTRVKASF